MSDDGDMTDWAIGQPPPWLTAYGPPPIDTPDVLAPPAATPGPDAAAAVADPAMAPTSPNPAAPSSPLGGWDFTQPGVGAAAAAAAPAPPAGAEGQIAAAADQGVDFKPSEDKLADLEAGNVAPGDRQKTIDEMTPADQARAVEQMSPEEYVRYQANRQGQMVAEAARMQHEQAAAQEQRARDALEIQRSSVAKADATMRQVVADAQRIADTKINPSRYDEKQGIGGAVRGFIAAVVGGAMSQYTGGRNLAMEQYNKYVENDIAAQHADLANQWKGIETRKGAVATEYERHGDLYHATLAYNLAANQVAAGELQSALQQFDPAGATAIRIRDGLTQVHQQTATMIAKAHDQLIKNNTEKAKQALDIANAGKTLAEARTQKGGGLANPDLERSLGFSPVAPQSTGPAAPQVKAGEAYATLLDVPPKERSKAFRLPSKNGVPGGWIVSNSEDNAKDATHMVGMYGQIDNDLNEMQKISIERDGAKTAGGTIWTKWRDNNEQHYEQLLVDAANTYGMMIHGRAPTSGVLEEVLKAMPELKAAWERGDTTELINAFRNDVDNRTSLRLQAWGGNVRITSDRPHVDKPNVNTIGATLTAPPVEGDKGFANLDVKDFADRLDRVFDEHKENPGLGGNKDYREQLDEAAAAQAKAVAQIRKSIDTLEASKKRTPEDKAKLVQNRRALQDREEAVVMIETAKKKDVDRAAAADAKAKQDAIEKQQQDRTPAGKRF